MEDKRYGVTYNNFRPDGVGATGPDFKPDRVTAPSVDGTCFANMQSSEDLEMHKALAPEFHNMVTKRIIAMGKVRDAQQANLEEGQILDEANFEMEVPEAMRPHKVKSVKAKATFSRGTEVIDRSVKRRGIIIQASVGFTKSTHSPVHKVCSSKGKVWLAKEYNLKHVL